MATFSVTNNQTLHASGTIGNGATVSDTLDLSTKIRAVIQLKVTPGGTVTASSVTTFNVYFIVDGTNAATVPFTSPAVAQVASTAASIDIVLDGGAKYKVEAVNGDASHSITYECLYQTIDTFS